MAKEPRKFSKEQRTIRVESDVVVDQGWIDFCVFYNDLFMTDHCGYWMSGIDCSDEQGWLVWEHPDGMCAQDAVNQPEYKKVIKAWKSGKPLPESWFRLDVDAAKKAWAEGCKRYGMDWYENSDATTYDVVVQLALLGEVRYG